MSMWVSIGYVETESAVKLFGDCAWTRKWERWELVGTGGSWREQGQGLQ